MKIVTAHDLRTGEVVYWTDARTWAPRIEAAAPLPDEAAEGELAVARAQSTIAANAYLVAIDLAGRPAKREYLRESIRANGPTVRRDLGKQAERAQ